MTNQNPLSTIKSKTCTSFKENNSHYKIFKIIMNDDSKLFINFCLSNETKHATAEDGQATEFNNYINFIGYDKLYIIELLCA